MYTIVMRHLSGIQKGIQAAHAIVEYANAYGNTAEYRQWAEVDKTLIVYEVHTTNALEKAMRKLTGLGIETVVFKEPDLGNATTAIAFLVNETVWNKGKYPKPDNDQSASLREFLSKFSLAAN